VRHLKVSTKLIGVIGGVALAAAAAVGWVVFRDAEQALRAQAIAQLDAERASRARALSTYFRRVREDLLVASKLLVTQIALREMPDAVRAFPQQLGRSAAPGTIEYQRLHAFYDQEIRSRFDASGIRWPGTDSYLAMAPPQLLLQFVYIAQNPNPVNRKDQQVKLGSTSAYDRLHTLFHPIARGLVQGFSYHDVFLIGVDGTVLYSCVKEIDFATNLRAGAFRDSGLGQAFARAAAANAEAVHFVDFTPYAPSFGAPASFISTPVFDAASGARLGVVAYQLASGEMNTIMNDAAGFGQSGETYVLGPDLLMRSNSRFSSDTTILKRKVETDAARRALAGESGTLEQTDYRGVRVLASYAPVEVEGVRWPLLAEIDLAEALAPVRQFRTKLAWLLAVVALAAGSVLWVALRRIVLSPVAALAAGARRVTTQDYAHPVELTKLDELGELGRAFNGMMSSVGAHVEELNRAQAALTTAEHEREMALAAAAVGLWRGEIASNVWTMDTRARAIMGLDADASLDADAWLRALHPDDRARAVSKFDEVMRTSMAYELEYRVVWPNGKIRHVLDRGLSSGPVGQKPTRVDGIFYDITQLRVAEQRGQRLLEAAPDAMVVVDATGTIAVINASAERLFGYTREELVGQPIEALVPESAAGGHVARRNHYLAAPAVRGMGSGLELQGRRKDGSLVPVEISLSPMEAADGLLVVAAVRDISDRRAAEKSLKESEERLGAAAGGAKLGLWDVEPQTGSVVVNAIFESQLGYPPLGLRETNDKWAKLRGGLAAWADLLHPDDREPVSTLIAQFLDGGADIYKAEQRVRAADGSYKWILSVGNTVARDESGRPLRANGVHIDISEMKGLQLDLQERYEELQRLEKLRDGLVHMIVHDLRSPLTSVMGYLDLLRTDPHASLDDRAMFVGEAYTGTSRISEMISSLLDINRLEAGEMPIDRQTVDLCDVAAEAIRSLGGLIVGRNVSQAVPEGPVVSSCDPALIRRVVGNLLGNALKFTPGSGSITVSVARANGRPRLEVADTGPGIPADFLGRVFDKFSQAGEGRKRKRYSTGLGLAFCKLAVEAHGGTIGVNSEVGVGSRFWFELPA
jgi:PAS domain S-box-containing protein